MEKAIKRLGILLQLSVLLIEFKYQGELICRSIACQLVHQLLNGEHFWHPNRLINEFPQVLGKK